jgi:hypothetical protein
MSSIVSVFKNLTFRPRSLGTDQRLPNALEGADLLQTAKQNQQGIQAYHQLEALIPGRSGGSPSDKTFGRFVVAVPDPTHYVAVNGNALFVKPLDAFNSIATVGRSLCLFPVLTTARSLEENVHPRLGPPSVTVGEDGSLTLDLTTLAGLEKMTSLRRIHLTSVQVTAPPHDGRSVFYGMTLLEHIKLTDVGFGSSVMSLAVPARQGADLTHLREVGIYSPRDPFDKVVDWFVASPGLARVSTLRLFASHNLGTMPTAEQVAACLDVAKNVENLAIDSFSLPTGAVADGLQKVFLATSGTVKRLYIGGVLKVDGHKLADPTPFMAEASGLLKTAQAMKNLQVFHFSGVSTLQQGMVDTFGAMPALRVLTLEAADARRQSTVWPKHNWAPLFGSHKLGWKKSIKTIRILAPMTDVVGFVAAMNGHPTIEEVAIPVEDPIMLKDVFDGIEKVPRLKTIGLPCLSGSRVPHVTLDHFVQQIIKHGKISMVWSTDADFTYDLEAVLKANDCMWIQVSTIRPVSKDPLSDW